MERPTGQDSKPRTGPRGPVANIVSVTRRRFGSQAYIDRIPELFRSFDEIRLDLAREPDVTGKTDDRG
jgi:hypothetical protein